MNTREAGCETLIALFFHRHEPTGLFTGAKENAK